MQSIAQLVFIVIPPTFLWIPISLSGIAEGGVFSTFPVLVFELFGAKHYGKNFGYISIANAIGYPLVLQPLSTLIYNYNATSDDGICSGNSCFDAIFGISAIACLASLYGSFKL